MTEPVFTTQRQHMPRKLRPSHPTHEEISEREGKSLRRHQLPVYPHKAGHAGVTLVRPTDKPKKPDVGSFGDALKDAMIRKDGGQ